MIPTRGDFLSAFLRTFAIQGSWNYRTMIGGGLAYALAPLLQRIYAGDPVALRSAIERHAAEFNAHPYMSPIAVGALARVEYEGRDPQTIERFRKALQAPLGALGDQAIWAGWRPFTSFVAVCGFLLWGHPLFAAVGFLVVYNIGHVVLRAWGLYRGWQAGREIGGVLARLPVKRVARGLVTINRALMGVLAALLVARIPGTSPDPTLAAVAAAGGLGGYLVPGRVGGVAIGLLFAASVVWAL